MNKYIYYFVLVFFSFGLFNSACESVNEANLQKIGLKEFSSHEEISHYILEVNKMTLNELKEFESKESFTSFGRKSEELYASINFDQFKSYEELVEFVKNHNQFLQMVKNSDGENYIETNFHTSIYRYVMNVDGQFKINDNVYKVLRMK